MCDKLNTTADVSSKINKVQTYYLLPISDTNGNKELHSHIEGIFNREHKKAVRYSETELEEVALKQSPSKGKRLITAERNLQILNYFLQNLTSMRE